MTAVLLAVASLGAAAGLYWGLSRFGNPELRGWAAPGAAALAAGGVGQSLGLPVWITLGAFFGALFLLHRKARERLAVEAKAVGKVVAPEAGWTLEAMPAAGSSVAAWTCRDGADPDPVVFTLEYAGEKEEDFIVTLSALAAKFKPGMLVAHRAGVPGAAPAVLADRAPVDGLPGQTDAVVFRCLPPDYAFALLDLKTLVALQELCELSRSEREVYAVVNGPELKVVCGGLPAREDIAALLAKAAVVFARLRFIGRQ